MLVYCSTALAVAVMSLLAPRTVLAQPATDNAQTRIVRRDAIREIFMAIASLSWRTGKRRCHEIGSGEPRAASQDDRRPGDHAQPADKFPAGVWLQMLSRYPG